MDPQDNTFPIPPADNTGGSTPPVAGQPAQPADLSAAQYPPAAAQQPAAVPVAPVQPQQPAWTNQAAADAAGLPPGPDNYSLTNPVPAPVADPAVQTGGFQTTTPQQNPIAAQPPMPASSNLVAPFATDPNAVAQAPTQIPADNTLDLSGQALPLAAAEPGAMQPGVDVSPTSQIGTPADQAYPMAPMAPQTQGGLPTDLGGSYNDTMTGMAVADAGRKKGPLKIILIIVAVLALLLIVTLAIVFSSRNQRKPAIELNEQTVQTQTTTDSTALPEGYKQVTRDCYGFGIIPQTTLDFARTACNISAKFGASSQYDIAVTPSTAPVSDLSSFAATLKAGTAVSQSNIKIGGLDATQLVQTVGGVTQQVIAVLPTGKSYTFNGAPVTAFVITTTYNDADSKTVSDNIVKTWAWK